MHTLSTRKNIKVIKIDHVSMQVPPPQSQQAVVAVYPKF